MMPAAQQAAIITEIRDGTEERFCFSEYSACAWCFVNTRRKVLNWAF